MKLNLLALLKDGSLKRIVSSGTLQDEITEYFINLKTIFENEKTEISFDGRYLVEDNEIFIIPNYPQNNLIINAISNPITLEILKLKDDREKLKALICGLWTATDKFILFQAIDSRKILSKKFTLINSNDTYTKIIDPGIIIDDHIDSILYENKLSFISYHNTRKIFDLSEYFKEATNDDLKDFYKNDMFLVEELQWFIDNSDTSMRKKVALLQKNKVLEETELKDIKSISKDFGIEIEIITDNRKKKIKFPKDKKKVKEIIRFLDEDYFLAPLTKRRCLTNSKQYLT